MFVRRSVILNAAKQQIDLEAWILRSAQNDAKMVLRNGRFAFDGGEVRGSFLSDTL